MGGKFALPTDKELRWTRMPQGKFTAMHGKWKQTGPLDGLQEFLRVQEVTDKQMENLMANLPNFQQTMEIAIYQTAAGQIQFKLKVARLSGADDMEFVQDTSFDGDWLG